MRRAKLWSRGTLVAVVGAVSLSGGLAVAAPPDTVSYQGRLTDPNGSPLEGVVVLTERVSAQSG